MKNFLFRMDKYHSEGAVIYISTMGVAAEAIS